MGALITIQYDAKIVTDQEADMLCRGIQEVTKQVMSQKDVFVYANKPIFILADPLEVFIQVNKTQIEDPIQLTEDIATHLSIWKGENNFKQPININIHPVEWHHKIGI